MAEVKEVSGSDEGSEFAGNRIREAALVAENKSGGSTTRPSSLRARGEDDASQPGTSAIVSVIVVVSVCCYSAEAVATSRREGGRAASGQRAMLQPQWWGS
mmetsp:Transcript_6498/g.10892  ORF Transcript_6498/g.10892 Transcript_6498/m.10892 type:complete len:101 (+) Transcript_6498:332-634(+)